MNAPPSAGRAVRARSGTLPFATILSTGLSVGVAGDLLLRGPGGPGLNVLLLYVALALAVHAVTGRSGGGPSREAAAWLAVGVLMATGVVVRAAPPLQVLAFLAAALAFALPAYRAGAAWIRRSGVSDHLEAVAGAVAWSALGASRLVAHRLALRPLRGEDETGGGRMGIAVLRGVLLAAPLLFVFGALFVSADRVFARLVVDFVRVDLEVIVSHVVVTGVLTWLACGYLTGFLTGTRARHLVESRIRRPEAGVVEVAVALSLIDLLFVAFVAVQFRYLFGGGALVEVTPGLTYAEYAREGFAQLAVASALVLPTLLASDWLLRREAPRDRWVFRALGGLQLVLLMVVLASAFQRVRAYQAAYGLTESRFYGAVFLGWLVLSSVWFGATVLRSRRERFAFPALVSGFAVVAGLLLVGPDTWIVRTNLARAGIGATGGAEAPAGRPGRPPAPADPSAPPSVDAEYLASLGGDAVPTLLRALPSLPPAARCRMARRLLERWDGGGRGDWRNWNWSVDRARRAVGSNAGRLREMLGPGGDCPERGG